MIIRLLFFGDSFTFAYSRGGSCMNGMLSQSNDCDYCFYEQNTLNREEIIATSIHFIYSTKRIKRQVQVDQCHLTHLVVPFAAIARTCSCDQWCSTQNMYCVVRGQKHFTLLPPSDVLFLYEQEYPQGRYRRKADGTGFDVEMEEGSVTWVPVGETGMFKEIFFMCR